MEVAGHDHWAAMLGMELRRRWVDEPLQCWAV